VRPLAGQFCHWVVTMAAGNGGRGATMKAQCDVVRRGPAERTIRVLPEFRGEENENHRPSQPPDVGLPGGGSFKKHK